MQKKRYTTLRWHEICIKICVFNPFLYLFFKFYRPTSKIAAKITSWRRESRHPDAIWMNLACQHSQNEEKQCKYQQTWKINITWGYGDEGNEMRHNRGYVSVFLEGKLQNRTSSVSVRTVGVLSASVLYSAILHSAFSHHFPTLFFVVEM